MEANHGYETWEPMVDRGDYYILQPPVKWFFEPKMFGSPKNSLGFGRCFIGAVFAKHI